MKEPYAFMQMPAAMRHHLLDETINLMPPSFQSHDEGNEPGMMQRFPKETPIAMAYVPMQYWGETYDAETGLQRGTIFKELDLPFGGDSCHV